MTNTTDETPAAAGAGLDPMVVIDRFEGFSSTVLTILGERLGMFRALAGGPATSTELADRCGVNERYVREWLAGVVAAGYVVADAGGRHHLTPGAEPVLASDDTPMSMGGAFEFLGALVRVLDDVEFAFRHGGGVSQDRYGPDCAHGLGRMNAPNYDHFLVPLWISGAGLAERLESGAAVVEVGCGEGRALLRLAEAYPASRYVGYDIFGAAVEAARSRIAAGGADVRFEVRDASRDLPERSDVVLAFDVIHDAADPIGLLRSMRSALNPRGVALIAEPEFEAEGYPLPVTNYAISLLYCMTTSLSRGGAGLGACGLPHATLADMARLAGFSSVDRVPAGTPLQRVYALRA